MILSNDRAVARLKIWGGPFPCLTLATVLLLNHCIVLKKLLFN